MLDHFFELPDSLIPSSSPSPSSASPAAGINGLIEGHGGTGRFGSITSGAWPFLWRFFFGIVDIRAGDVIFYSGLTELTLAAITRAFLSLAGPVRAGQELLHIDISSTDQERAEHIIAENVPPSWWRFQ